ncbi:Tim44/TimA family putative adaptor protein [Candidatus Pelagibacter sp.]|nr:Tim44/TimA family putative adaptor protein [Candidatus Pelagibacter sp.]
MSYSFEYVDIILLAMIAGFIFLRLRGILGKRSGFEAKVKTEFKQQFVKKVIKDNLKKENFGEKEKNFFLEGAKIAYETIITDFSDSDNKLTKCKSLLDKKIYNDFEESLKERELKGNFAETTFIGINSATIKEYNEIENYLVVTVDFVSELITCIRDKEKKIVSGDPEKIKKVYDTWKFSKDIRSSGPNWLVTDIIR